MTESEKSELNCRQCLEMLDAFHDMELSSDEAGQVEEHLAGCADCRQYLIEVERVVASLQALPTLEMKRDLADIIETKILAAHEPMVRETVGPVAVPGGPKVVPMTRWLYAAAAVVLVLIGLSRLAPDAIRPQSASLNSPQSGIHTASGSDSASNKLIGGQTEKIASAGSTATEIGAESGAAPVSQESKVEPESLQAAAKSTPAGSVESSQPAATSTGRAADIERKILAGVGNKEQAKADLNNNHVSDGDEVVALYGDAEGSETGLSTSEDGLYAIKL